MPKDKHKTNPGAVDHDAMGGEKKRRAAQKRQLDEAWNTGRNNADPARKNKAQVDQN